MNVEAGPAQDLPCGCYGSELCCGEAPYGCECAIEGCSCCEWCCRPMVCSPDECIQPPAQDQLADERIAARFIAFVEAHSGASRPGTPRP